MSLSIMSGAFRNWLRNKYKDIGSLNQAWWTTFWSHTYNSFNQVESPSSIGDHGLHGLNLDWKRFVTDQTIDFYVRRDTFSTRCRCNSARYN